MGRSAERDAACWVSALVGGRAGDHAGPRGRVPLEQLLQDYCRYLRVERALCDHTVLDAYVPAARLFLAGLGRPGRAGAGAVRAADVSSFLAGECPNRSVSAARDLVCALRSLLRYLHWPG